MAIPVVEKAKIEKAILLFDQELRNAPEWNNWEHNRAHKFAISANDRLYPAKKIVSLATSSPVDDFKGGSTTNKYLLSQGFIIVDLHQALELAFVKGQLYDRKTEIHEPFGGSHQSGIAPSRKSPAIFIFTGNSGEQFGYQDEVTEDGVYTYTGEGQTGDMELSRGNLAILNHAESGRSLYLFKSMGKGKGCKYIDEFCCVDHFWMEGLDGAGKTRQIIKFHLIPVSHLILIEKASVQESNFTQANISLSEARRIAFNASIASQSKASKTTIQTIYARSQQVKDYVLMRASGKCESCGNDAPFSRKNGTPYLEPHHINRLSDGGLDHPRFMGAICPTCHSEIHYGLNGSSKNKALCEAILQKEHEMDAKQALSKITRVI